MSGTDAGVFSLRHELRRLSLNINEVFSKGGKTLIDFLDYCVRSIQMDPVFIFLVQEYRKAPTAGKAVALYDIFCAPRAAGRISADKALPLGDPRLMELIRPLKANWSRLQAARLAAENPSVPLLLPPKYLFDSLVTTLEQSSQSLRKIRRRYNPQRSPVENLPRGKMTPVQRHFVDNIWEPKIRPQLVAAGFWRIATIA